MAYDNTQKPDIKTTRFMSLDLTSYDENKKVRRLFWSTRDGNPRITVYTDSEILKPDGKMDYDKVIIAPFSAMKLKMAIKLFKEIVAEGKNDYVEIDCMYNKYDKGVRTDELLVKATVRFGIDKDGVCYFYLMDGNKPKIKFNIGSDGWHVIRKGREAVNPLSVGEMSQRLTVEYFDLIVDLFKLDFIEKNRVTRSIPAREDINIALSKSGPTEANSVVDETKIIPKDDVLEVKEANSLEDLF